MCYLCINLNNHFTEIRRLLEAVGQSSRPDPHRGSWPSASEPHSRLPPLAPRENVPSAPPAVVDVRLLLANGMDWLRGPSRRRWSRRWRRASAKSVVVQVRMPRRQSVHGDRLFSRLENLAGNEPQLLSSRSVVCRQRDSGFRWR